MAERERPWRRQVELRSPDPDTSLRRPALRFVPVYFKSGCNCLSRSLPGLHSCSLKAHCLPLAKHSSCGNSFFRSVSEGRLGHSLETVSIKPYLDWEDKLSIYNTTKQATRKSECLSPCPWVNAGSLKM